MTHNDVYQRFRRKTPINAALQLAVLNYAPV
jgi:hypothetical protein